MVTVTIRLVDESNEITRASVTEALSQAIMCALGAVGSTERAAVHKVIRKIGDVSARLLGDFETRLIADEICMRAERGFGALRAGATVERELRCSWRKVVPGYIWDYGLALEDEDWLPKSTEALQRADRLRPILKFADMPLKEVHALMKAGDKAAQAAMADLSDGWRVTAAQLRRRFSVLGPEETYRRAGLSYPSAIWFDADEGAPVDEAAPAPEAAA